MRALVVEDEPDVAADLRLALEAIGFLVDHSADGRDAWFQGDVEDYDVAILDLGLPQLDGLSVLRRWRAEGRAFPVIIVSARGDWTERVQGIDAGADDYLGKPFEMAELIARVRGVLRRAAGRGSNVVIAGRLRVSVNTVRSHIQNLTAKLGVHSTLEAVALRNLQCPHPCGAGANDVGGLVQSDEPFLAPPAYRPVRGKVSPGG